MTDFKMHPHAAGAAFGSALAAAVLSATCTMAWAGNTIANIDCSNEQHTKGEDVVCEYAMIGSKYKDLDQLLRAKYPADAPARLDKVRQQLGACADLHCVEPIIDAAKSDAESAPDPGQQAPSEAKVAKDDAPPAPQQESTPPDAPAATRSASAAASVESKNEQSHDTAAPAPADGENNNAAIGTLVFVILVLGMFFKGRGSDKGEPKAERKGPRDEPKAKAQPAPARVKVPVTCPHCAATGTVSISATGRYSTRENCKKCRKSFHLVIDRGGIIQEVTK